jgi:hypothetical protein
MGLYGIKLLRKLKQVCKDVPRKKLIKMALRHKTIRAFSTLQIVFLFFCKKTICLKVLIPLTAWGL